MIKTIILTPTILLVALLSIALNATHTQAQQISPSTQPQIIAEDSHSIIIEYTVNEFEITQIQTKTGPFDQLTIPNTSQQSQPGQPQVPVTTATIGIPTGADVTLTILTAETEAISGMFRLPSTAHLDLSQSLPDNLLHDESALLTVQDELIDLPATNKDTPPHQPVVVGTTQNVRGQEIVQILFSPVAYDPQTKGITLYRTMQAQLSWTVPALQSAAKPKQESPFFEPILAETILNYDQLNRTTVLPTRKSKQAAESTDKTLHAASIPTNTLVTTNTLKIWTTEAGIHNIDYATLAAAGFNLTGDPQQLQLTNKGEQVAIWVTGEEDGTFDEDDTITFYAELQDSTYSGKNIYWLTNGENQGLRMTSVDGSLRSAPAGQEKFRQSLHAEINDNYWQTMPDGAGQDHWFWGGRLTAPITTTRIITLTSLPTGTDAAGLTADLRIALKGRSDAAETTPDHHTTILINGTLVDDQFWDGYDSFVHSIPLTQTLLHSGPNTITIQALGDTGASVDQFFIDWIEVDYWRYNSAANNKISFSVGGGRAELGINGFTSNALTLFEISDPKATKRITGFVIDDASIDQPVAEISARFTHSSTQAANYIGLAEDVFEQPARMELATISNLSASTNGADYILITHADFLTRTLPLAAFREEQGLRVITATTTQIFDEFSHGIFDPQAIRDFLAYTYQNWEAPAPTYVLFVGDATLDYRDRYKTDSINFVPSQLIETQVLGQTPSDNWFVQLSGEDVLPDMLIGRLSAQTPKQVTQLVQKVIDYETNPPDASWNSQVLFVADDDSSSFTTTTEELSALLPQAYTINRIDLGTYEAEDDPPTDINAAINQGALFTNYTGHGAVNRWGKWGDNQTIYANDDIDKLANLGKETILTAANCLNGFFAGFQTSNALAEQFQRHTDGGAVAVLAPSNLFYPSAHRAYLAEFYGEFYQKETVTLGAATTKAKISVYAQSNNWNELVEAYILFGDPATSLERVLPPAIQTTFLPLVNKN